MGLSILADKKAVPDKREKIIKAAISIFAEQGYYNSTVSDVAKLAQVADGTIYLYFKSKDDLLISIFEYSIDIFIQSAVEEISKIENPRERFEKFIEWHLKLVQKNQDLAQVIQIELRQSTKFLKEYANEKFFEYLKIIENIIEEGKKLCLFKPTLNSQILRRAIFGAVDEIALEWVLMKKKRYSIEEAVKQLTDLFLVGLNS